MMMQTLTLETDCKIGVNGVRALCEMLKQNTTLEKLNIGGWCE